MLELCCTMSPFFQIAVLVLLCYWPWVNAKPAPPHSFETYKDHVKHILHRPQVEAATDLGATVDDADLSVRLHFPVGDGGRMATVEAFVAQDLIGPNYKETYYRDGNIEQRTLDKSQHRFVVFGS